MKHYSDWIWWGPFVVFRHLRVIMATRAAWGDNENSHFCDVKNAQPSAWESGVAHLQLTQLSTLSSFEEKAEYTGKKKRKRMRHEEARVKSQPTSDWAEE